MLHYGIGALLIVLVITLTLSYYYNMEGFAAIAPAAPTTAPTAADVASGIASADNENTVAVPAPTKKDVTKTTHNHGTLSNKPSSQAVKENNIDNILKKDKLLVKAEYKGQFLRVFASMPSLSDNEAQQMWLIGSQDAGIAPPIWKLLIITNDSSYESAAIPEANYRPYIGQTVYIVPRGSSNPDDAYASFIIPIPPSKPNVINPKITLSDTGYSAMKLNKHSNLLNDVQKIIHNEMLANRSLDVIVKNPNSRSAATGFAGSTGSAAIQSAIQASKGPMTAKEQAKLEKSIEQLPSKLKKKAIAKMEEEGSCGGSSSGSCDSGSCGDSCHEKSEDDADMSKYIRKDQIPCWGCSLDY